MEELVRFCNKAGYRKLGLAFCVGLADEARAINDILVDLGFTMFLSNIVLEYNNLMIITKVVRYWVRF